MTQFAPLFAAFVFAAVSSSNAYAVTSQPTQHGSSVHAKASKAKPANTTSHKKTAVKAKAAVKAPARPAIDYLGEQVNFSQWHAVAQFIDQMVARHGFERSTLEAQMGQVRFVESAVQLVKPAPPGKPKNWQVYRSRFIEPIRINAGVRFWNENADALARAEATYGVPAEILVGIIGVETVYGRDTGRFRVLDTLTTLGFAYPDAPNQAARSQFFRGELENTLLLARHEGIDPFTLLGSFAGAVGLPQFMPGNILKYGVDFDGDGHIDLRGSSSDAIGSVAKFLIEHGWVAQDSSPAVIPVSVSAQLRWEPLLERGLVADLTPEELSTAGVVARGTLAPSVRYGLVDLQNGAEPTEYWAANANFFAITKYNRSYFYAMSVIELGQAVRAARAERADQLL